MRAGDGPETSVSVAPPAQGASAEGVTFMSAPAPLLKKLISSVMSWPGTTPAGSSAREAVKSPMTTLLDETLADLAVPDPLEARAAKDTLPIESAPYFQIMLLVWPGFMLNWSLPNTTAPEEWASAVVELQPLVAPVNEVAVLPL